MYRLIEQLRERPEEDRKAVAIGGAITVMSVLLFGWGIATLYSSDATPAETQAASPTFSNSRTPQQQSDTTGSFSEDLRRIQEANTSTSSIATTTASTTE